MRRGDVWTVSGRNYYAGKPRPAVIVQSDIFDNLESVTLCGLSATSSDSPFARPVIDPAAENGLVIASRVLVDKVTTVPVERLGSRIGRLSAEDMARIDAALLLFLALDAK